MESLIFLLNIAKVALGLGFVIFVHELGHFLLAKWNGVKVEKFSIGFGPTLLGWRRGDTEYVLAALPLGGFVKMLGEGPDEQENNSTDPRAYPNKSDSARMAIISAGVIMNLFLAAACFVFYFGNERHDSPAVLGAVVAGSPAYEAGLLVGDEVVSIDGRGDLGFTDLLQKVLLSSQGQTLHLEVKRPGHKELIGVDIQPRREATGDRPTIGILSSHSLEIGDFEPLAGMVNPPAYQEIDKKDRRSKMDLLVAAAAPGKPPTPLTDINQYSLLLARNARQAITHAIDRRPNSRFGAAGAAAEKIELTVPRNHFVDFGLRLEILPVASIRKGSPADKAGFRKGDRIVKVDGDGDFDPMQLPFICFEKAGKSINVEVERASGGAARKTLSLAVTPDELPPRTEFAQEKEPVDVPALGLCFPVATHVLAVRPNSPASRAGLKPGDVINSIAIPTAKSEPSSRGVLSWLISVFNWNKGERPKVFEFSDESPNWFAALIDIQNRPIQPVKLTVNHGSKPIEITPEPDPNWFNPARGLLFFSQVRTLPPQNFATALRSGYDLTIQNILMVYGTFRSLAERRVSPKNLGGPIMIATVAYSAAGSSLTDLIYFLGILSINLAVLNFLPVPPLDGGQMIFLIAEKVRGRPLPESAVIAGTYFGLILVLSLMVFVTYQDVFRLFTG